MHKIGVSGKLKTEPQALRCRRLEPFCRFSCRVLPLVGLRLTTTEGNRLYQDDTTKVPEPKIPSAS